MVRRIRDTRLETRSARDNLKIKKRPTFVSIGQGLSIGYRRNKAAGTWVFRKADGKGGMQTKTIAMADDHVEANGVDVLDFWQAITKVRELGKPKGGLPGRMTVEEAFVAYLPGLEGRNARSAKATKGRVKKHILPSLGSYAVADLTKTQLEGWQASLVKKSDDDKEVVRKSQDTANRILSMLKALLNHAWNDEKNVIPSDQAWRKVKPFKDVGRPREVRFSPPETHKLVENIDDTNFKELVRGGYGTGARYEELTDAKVAHFDRNGKTLNVSGKTGSRPVLLQLSVVDLLTRITAGRPRDAYIFVKSDGSKWKPSDQVRPMKKAVLKTNLDPDGCFYSLRHTYISESIEKNVPLTVIAKNCGTSVRMIENTYAKVLLEKQREFVERGAPELN